MCGFSVFSASLTRGWLQRVDCFYSFSYTQNMYTVRQAYEFLYPMINQHGATRLVWPNNFIPLINHAIAMVYNYEWYIRSFTHRKDLFHMANKTQWVLASRRPVRVIDKFWAGPWKDVYNIQKDECYCNFKLPDKAIKACCECGCIEECEPLPLKKILPHNKLCAGQYQVAWGFVPWQGGLDGRIVHVDTGKPVEALWMSYFCWPVPMQTFDDIIPLPDAFVPILALIMAAIVLPNHWASRQQEDLNYYSLYRKELDYLKKVDNINPVTLDFKYEYDTPSTPAPFTTWSII